MVPRLLIHPAVGTVTRRKRSRHDLESYLESGAQKRVPNNLPSHVKTG